MDMSNKMNNSDNVNLANINLANINSAKMIRIKYKISDIMMCREVNQVIPAELIEYMSNDYKCSMDALNELEKIMDETTRYHSSGIDPNDMQIKSKIRENLNKVNVNNYSMILDELKSISYKNCMHFVMLATEIITKCMNDSIVSRDIGNVTDEYKSPSELYISIAQEFSQTYIIENGKANKFKTIMASECKQYFDKFTIGNDKMDSNNMNRVTSFKGFMNMIGLMYAMNMLKIDTIINNCIIPVTNIVIGLKLSADETDNFYTGLHVLLQRLNMNFKKLEKKPNPNPSASNAAKEDSIKLATVLETVFNKIIESYEKSSDPKQRPIRLISYRNLKNLKDNLCVL
jgi:uncharacterized membrane protein